MLRRIDLTSFPSTFMLCLNAPTNTHTHMNVLMAFFVFSTFLFPSCHYFSRKKNGGREMRL